MAMWISWANHLENENAASLEMIRGISFLLSLQNSQVGHFHDLVRSPLLSFFCAQSLKGCKSNPKV